MSGNQAVRKLVIVGGGTAGWMAAASLKHHFRATPLSVTVVESTQIGTVGVGEATIPTIRRFYAQLGMSDAEIMRATEATCKLGIRFFDWQRPGDSFIHPFGLFGQDAAGIGFHHYWLKLRDSGAGPLEDYSLGACLARAHHFTTPVANPPSQLSVFDWALHFDAALFANHLRQFAEKAGCERIDARITQVNLRPSDGHIKSLTLDSGVEVEGDLFIDCSGFRSLLLGEALGVPYVDWSQWLLCDTAFAVQTERTPDLPPYTSVTARTAGWQWKIPLQHRAGNGIVFSSRHMSDADARDELMANLPAPPIMEPRRIAFNPGRRDSVWSKNCVALGLASGFLEPLESTSIALIENGIERLKQFFPAAGFEPSLIDEYNRQSRLEMERVRDFIVLHYMLNGRDGDFWRDCREMSLPDTLRHKTEVWRASGQFVRYSWEMFSPASWLAIYAGFGDLPARYDPAVDAADPAYLMRSLAEMRCAIADTVADTPTHEEFIASLASAPAEPLRRARG